MKKITKSTIIAGSVFIVQMIAPQIVDGEVQAKNNKIEVKRGYQNNLYYVDGKLANWWYDDGRAWYFFKDGKKLTGYGKDNSGTKYFVNGKYATGVYGGKTYKEGLEVNKGITRGYHNNLYYVNGKLANWWYDDGTAWYFFKDGKKLTGYGKDNSGTKYFANGKYATGVYGGKTYKEGLEVKKETRGYHNNLYYVNGKLANWWYDDGREWYFFKDGKKLTGYGRDNSGTKYFVNGKYANWWYDDGAAWYFFKDGKKLTGHGRDNSGTKYFVNGKYATGAYGGKMYKEGIEVKNSIQSYYKVTSLYIPVYDANGKILSHISQGTIVHKDNRSYSQGRIPIQIAGLTGYVNPSGVQAINEKTTFIPDYVSDGKYVYHRYTKSSKLKVAYHNPNMVVGKSYYSADGINFGSFKLDHPFQFSNLKSKTNYSAHDINRLYSIMGANNSKLAGKGATFKAAEQRYGVNALYLVAHSALESAWGRSNIAKNKNNFFGIAAYDSSPYTSATKFDNVDGGILGAARWINEKYLTGNRYPARGAYLGNKAGGMNVNYATAPFWGESIASIMFEANERLGRKDK